MPLRIIQDCSPRPYAACACLLVTLALLLSAGCSGGDKNEQCNVNNGDECMLDENCAWGKSCGASCTCVCDLLMGAGCERNSDCTGGATCNLDTCQCVGLVEIPENTTNCTVDGDGCLVGGEGTCYAQFTAPLGGSTATVHVEGTLIDNMATQAVHVRGYVGTLTPPYFYGYSASISRNMTTVTGSLFSNQDELLTSETWGPPSGDYSFQMDVEMDTGATSSSMTVTGNSAPSTPIASTAMGTAEGTTLIIEAWRARVCRVTVTSP